MPAVPLLARFLGSATDALAAARAAAVAAAAAAAAAASAHSSAAEFVAGGLEAGVPELDAGMPELDAGMLELGISCGAVMAGMAGDAVGVGTTLALPCAVPSAGGGMLLGAGQGILEAPAKAAFTAAAAMLPKAFAMAVA